MAHLKMDQFGNVYECGFGISLAELAVQKNQVSSTAVLPTIAPAIVPADLSQVTEFAPMTLTAPVESINTQTQAITPEGTTTLNQTNAAPGLAKKVLPKYKLTGLSRAAQVKAMAEARKSGQVTSKLPTDAEKKFLTRHPFLDFSIE